MGVTAGPARPVAIRHETKTDAAQSTGATNGTFIDISFPTNSFLEGSEYIEKPNSTDFRLVFAGIYRASFSVTTDPAANDTGWEARAVLDGVAISHSRIQGSGRAITAENNTIEKSFTFRTTTANQIVKFQAAPTEATATDVVPTYTSAEIELISLT